MEEINQDDRINLDHIPEKMSDITEESIEKSITWLKNNIEKASEIRALRIYNEKFEKSMKAMCMKKHLDKTVAGQEREALADPEYIEFLQLLKKSVQDDIKMTFIRETASVQLSYWQSKLKMQQSMNIKHFK